MQCPVHDCRQVLGSDGRPLHHCDWQQGRCPMQKKAFDWNNKFDRFAAIVLVPLMFVLLFVMIYVELS